MTADKSLLAALADLAAALHELPVVTPEDLIVYKAVAWRERDRSDIERLLVLYGHTIDLDRIRTLIRQVAEVLEEPERASAFEALVRRALG